MSHTFVSKKTAWNNSTCDIFALYTSGFKSTCPLFSVISRDYESIYNWWRWPTLYIIWIFVDSWFLDIFPPKNSNQWLLLNECQVDVDSLNQKHMNNVNQQKAKMNGTLSWKKKCAKNNRNQILNTGFTCGNIDIYYTQYIYICIFLHMHIIDFFPPRSLES